MAQHITIIGDGSMATVCALLLDSNGHKVTVWGAFADHVADLIQTRFNNRYLPGHRIPESIRFTADDRAAFKDAQIIISAVPTQFIRPVWDRLAAHAPAAVPIASVAKGIENETLLRPTQIIADVLLKKGQGPRAKGQGAESGRETGDRGQGTGDRGQGTGDRRQGTGDRRTEPTNPKSEIRNPKSAPDHPDRAPRPLATISGPSVAEELARCLPATVCAASDDEKFALQLQDILTTSWFRVYTNTDLLGVELAAATKNVIAVAAGILDGLQAGNNAKSALLSRGLAEITRLGVAMGAKQDTFFGIAGVGDLATTCFSPTGRNRTCGEQLGRGKKLEEVLKSIPGVVEGVPTTKSVVALAQKYKVEMPITQAVHQVLFEGLDPIEAISRLMSRAKKPERVG